jgi:2-keto-4-pentenoate hydratase
MDSFAAALIAAHRTGARFVPGDAVPVTLDQAYRVQSRVIDALGQVAAFKTALKPGEAPIMAPIRAQHCLKTGASVQMGDRMGIELEVGWQIIAPLPASDAPDFDAALRRAILPLPVIELVDTRVEGPLAEDPIVKLADFQINHGLILGKPLDSWDGADFSGVTAGFHAGEQILLAGKATVPGGSALGTLAALIRAIGTHCGGLQVGQVVITGSLHPLTYVNAPCEVAGEIEGLGKVSLTLA